MANDQLLRVSSGRHRIRHRRPRDRI